MFLALRDLAAAKGRFALITVTVAMMALLVSFLSGLTGGLAHQNISFLPTVVGQAKKAEAYIASEGSLERSTFTIPSKLLDEDPATAVRISQVRVASDSFALFSTRAGAKGPVTDRTPLPQPGHVVLSTSAAKTIGADAGETITINDEPMVIDGISDDEWYAHQQVIWGNLPTDAPATFVMTSGETNQFPGLTGVTPKEMLQSIASHKAESTSLNMINVMLLLITALVTGAFFTVWTIQRKPDIATLKALGATTSALVVDALGQAAIILIIGIGLGLAITVSASMAIGDGLPFVVNPSTTVVPAVAMFFLGLAGAGASLLFLRSANPLEALGGAR